MKSEMGMRRAAVGWSRGPVHSYTAMARVTEVVEVALSVWARRGASRSARVKQRPPMERRGCMFAMVDQVEGGVRLQVSSLRLRLCSGFGREGRLREKQKQRQKPIWGSLHFAALRSR
jgi:hypothetical protein